MVSDFFLIRLALAFAVGGGWATFVTWVADAVDTDMGVVLVGLPSTAAFAFLFIGWAQSPEAAAEATTVFPLVFSFTGAFLLFYAFLAKYGFGRGLLGALVLWFALSFMVLATGFQDFYASLALCLCVSTITGFVFVRKMNVKSLDHSRKKISRRQLLLRVILSGSIVSIAVFVSQTAGPLVGGVASAFPAVFTSTLIIVNSSQGTYASRAMAQRIMMTTMLTMIPYSTAVRFLYPSLGVGFGTAGAYLVAFPFALISYYLFRTTSEFSKRRGVHSA